MSQKKVVQLKWNDFIAYIEYEIIETCLPPPKLCFRLNLAVNLLFVCYFSPNATSINTNSNKNSLNYVESEDTRRWRLI